MKKILFIFLAFILFAFQYISIHAQTAYHHISDKALYDFLDEAAALHYIDIATVVKPYSRKQIANWLNEINLHAEELTPVMKDRLAFWQKEFMIESGKLHEGHLTIVNKQDVAMQLLPPQISYQDSFFTALMRPIYGFRMFNVPGNNFWNSYGGAEAIANMGKNWAVYMSLRDNYQSEQKMSQPNWYTLEPGGTYKAQTGGGGGGEFSEMRAGFVYSWKWGNFGLMKDHLCWGDNQHGSNILSGRTPSYPMIKLYLNPAKWVEFNYHHGWLVSQAVDSAASFFPPDGPKRTVMRRKYIAANMFTVKPFKYFHFSFGNSIVYGDMDVQPAYLIPFAFYKSIVHTINWGTTFQNNALFLNLSSRNIKHLHLYASYFVDEFSIRRVTDPNRHNFTSFKGGFTLTGWPLKNVVAGAEYTRTNPITFLHDSPTTSYQSNKYNLGHYLTDNAEEYYAVIKWYPWRTLSLSASYVHARKGNYYEYVRGQTNPKIDELPVLKDIIWEQKSLGFHLMYYPVSNIRLFLNYFFSNVQGRDADGRTAQYYLNRFSAQYLHGKKQIIEAGFGLGF